MHTDTIKFGNGSVIRTRHLRTETIHHVEWLPNGRDLLLAYLLRGDDDGGVFTPVPSERFSVQGAFGSRRLPEERERKLADKIIARGQRVYAFSPDGRQAAVPRLVQPRGSSTECRIDLIRTEGRAKSFKTSEVYAYPDDLEYARSGKYLFLDRIYTTQVRDADGRLVADMEHLGENFGFAFDEKGGEIYSPLVTCSNTEERLLSQGRRPGTIERFRIEKGKTYPKPVVWAEQPNVQSARLHPSGAWLAAYGGGEIRCWSVPDGAALGSVRLRKSSLCPASFGAEYVSMDFNAAGDLLAVSDGYKAVVLRAFDGGGLETLGVIDLGIGGGGTRIRTRFSRTADAFLVLNSCGIHGASVTTVDLSPITKSFHR